MQRSLSTACVEYTTKSSIEVARDALKDILIHLQQQVVANLKIHWQQETFVDFLTLQDVSDSSQDRCVLVLMQLQQRIITSGPIENLTPPPLNPSSSLNRALPAPPYGGPPIGQITESFSVPPELPSGTSFDPNKPQSPSNGPPTPPNSPPHAPYEHHRKLSRGSPELAGVEGRGSSLGQYRPMATTVTKAGFFGFGKRTKVEPVVEPPENPLVDEYLATALEDEHRGASRNNSISTARSSILVLDHSDSNPRRDSNGHHSPSPPAIPRPGDKMKTSLDSNRRAPNLPTTNMEVLTSNRSLNSMNPKDLLPGEMNNYAGFCKGAWRQQIGDRKKALEERVRPGGFYNAAKFWQCKQCKFEGRLIPLDKKSNGYDMRVFKLVEGIQFRWEFLFKSHTVTKGALSDPTRATFGCIFCCAEGRGTATFSGVHVFMGHLIEHRDRLPTGEVLYRMNCLVGRQAAMHEDFDINIVSKEGGQI